MRIFQPRQMPKAAITTALKATKKTYSKRNFKACAGWHRHTLPEHKLSHNATKKRIARAILKLLDG